MRSYTFAPLDKVVTMKGKVLTKHRNLPTEEQDEAMSEYVDSMNLMKYERDEDGYYPCSINQLLIIGNMWNIFFRKMCTRHLSIESVKSFHIALFILMLRYRLLPIFL